MHKNLKYIHFNHLHILLLSLLLAILKYSKKIHTYILNISFVINFI